MKSRAYHYEIRIKEPLADCRLEWFPTLAIIHCQGDEKPDGASTIISGSFPDQSALFGVLARIRDLNLTLLSVRRVDSK